MEETKKKFPSLPMNYVSLQQLQEQRLREQQQKQKDKEEEERKIEEQRLKEEKEKQRKKEQEEKKRLLVSQKALRIKSYDETSNRNGRNFSQKSWLIKKKNEAVRVINPDQKLEEVEPKEQKNKRNGYQKNGASKIRKGEAEIIVAVESEEVPDLNQNHKEIETRKKYKGKKPMTEEETLFEELKESITENTPAIPNENFAGGKNTRIRYRRIEKKPPSPESVPLNQEMEIELKIGGLRICNEKKKSTLEKKKNGDYSGVMPAKTMINRRKPMAGNLMWIRKDEKTDGLPVDSDYIAGKF